MSRKFLVTFRILFIFLALVCSIVWTCYNLYPTYDIVNDSIKITNTDNSFDGAEQYKNATLEFDIVRKNTKKHIKLVPTSNCTHSSHKMYIGTEWGFINIDGEFIDKFNNNKFNSEFNAWMLALIMILGSIIVMLALLIIKGNNCDNCACHDCPIKKFNKSIRYISDDHYKRINAFWGYKV